MFHRLPSDVIDHEIKARLALKEKGQFALTSAYTFFNLFSPDELSILAGIHKIGGLSLVEKMKLGIRYEAIALHLLMHYADELSKYDEPGAETMVKIKIYNGSFLMELAKHPLARNYILENLTHKISPEQKKTLENKSYVINPFK